MKIWRSSSEFFVFPWLNLDFKHALDAEMSLEEDQNKIFKYYMVQEVRSI